MNAVYDVMWVDSMDHQMDNQVEKKESNQEYLLGIARELLGDPTWELPPEYRFFLAADLEWGLLAL